MAVNDFVRRSMQIVAGGIAQSTTDYFDNAISFANDVKEVIDMGKQMGSDGAKKFNELKNSGILKKTRDWFYNEGGMFGDFDFDDDFDAGFEIDSADSESSSDKSQPLSKDMMTDIAKKQTGAMYKAFGRQADLYIANTAEIISTINTRTAELTASVNNVNNTLIQIGKRLDMIVEWTSARTKKEEEQLKKASILDYSGGISLSGVVNKAKENAEDSILGTMLSIGKTMFSSGMMTPEMLLSTILSQTVLDKKWDKLGGKSVNDIGEFINDTVGEAIQNAFTKVLTTDKEPFASFFGDIISRGGNRNYQNSVTNQYNDKPAVFDGMTRKSIITVIPGYLNEILKAVSGGREMNVDNKGNLKAGTGANSFVKTVAENYFKSGTMDWKQREKASEGTGLTTTEVSNAVRTLTGSWIWSMYAYDIVVLKIGQIKDMSDPITKEVVNDAARAMASADPKHRSVEKWISLYKGIIYEIDEFKYRQELQRSAEKADKNLEDFAKHHVNNHQAGKVDESVWMAAFRDMYKDYNKDAKFNDPSTGGSIVPSPIGGSTSPLSITELDYMAGVFDRLNRGINVFITGQADNRSAQYKKIRMIPGYAKRAMGAGTTNSDDPDKPKDGISIPGPVGKIAEKVFKPKDTALRKAAGEKDPELVAAMDRIAEGKGDATDEEMVEKFKKEYGKPTNFFKRLGNTIKTGWNKYADESRKMGIIADPEGYAMVDDMVEKVKGVFSEILPDRAKSALTKVESNEKYQDVINSKGAQKAKSGVNKAANEVVDIFAGKRGVDENGEAIRTGGVLHAITKPVTAAGGFAKRKADNLAVGLRAKTMTNDALMNKSREVLADYGPDKQFDDSNKDALQMQLIASEMNTALSNGDFSTVDEQTILKSVNKIEDADLKGQLRQSVLPLLKKNGKAVDDKGGGDAPKSTIGKLLKMALGGLKLFLAPVIGYVKVVLFGVFKFIKGFGTAILKFAKWGIMRGLRQIKYGMKSLGFGIKTMFKSMTKLIKPAIDGLYAAVNAVKKGVTTAFENVKKSVSGWLEKRAANKNDKPKPANEETDKKKGLIGTISGFKENLANKFSEKPGFMKGFTKAYRDRKEAEKKASLKEQAAPTTTALQEAGVPEIKTGVETIVDTVGQIKDALTGKDPKGIVEEVKVQFQELKDKIDEESQEIQDNADGGGENAVAGALETTQAEVTDITMNGGAGGGVEGALAAGATLMTGGAAGGAAGAAEGAAAGAAEAGAAEGAGAAMGGMMNVLMGISNIVLTIVMSLEGFKAMISTVTDILTEALMPLNEAFQTIIKTLKPYVKQLGSIIKQLAGFIVQIVEVVCDIIQPIMKDVIQPILEVLSPLLESIIGCLTPLLKIVGILLKVILAPLMGLFKFVLLPILKIIGDAVQIIMGVLQIGFGVLMMGIGGIISAIGGVLSLIGKIPVIGAGAKKLGSGILDTGKDMMSQGKEFVVQGGKSVAQGAINLVLDYASLYTMGMTDELLGRNEEEKKETKQIDAPDGNQVETTFANGDITNVYNTYGGEYQRGMGGYLNMNQRGCGPIALADMYNRNSEGRISARSLAGMMNQSGAYDPHRGTSVGDYIDTARGLGMNVHAGKVTQQSLKSASPTNPITVVGSGSDYGTRNGNNHFMNVIGTDHHGGAYVSNPLTGRIDRRPASTVAGSAVMGIYGSGDESEESGYTFPDAIKEAFKKLKDEAAKILGLFSMEKSDEEETEELINAEKKKEAVEQAKKQMGDDYDAYAEEAKGLALEDFKKKYPQRDNESDEEYQERFDKWWETKANQAEYLAKTELLDKASEKGQDAYAELAKTNQKFVDDYAGKVDENGNISGGLFDKLGDAYTEFDSALDSLGGGGRGGQSGLDVMKGAALAFKAYVDAHPSGMYLHSDVGPLTADDGYTWSHFRPDCSGFMSASIRHMGYDFKGSDNDTTGPLTYNFNENLSSYGTKTIVDQNGNSAEEDWEVLPYSENDLRPGDWIFTSGRSDSYPESHVGMYIGKDSSGSHRGLDGGGTQPILDSAQAAPKVLEGVSSGDGLRWTMQPSDHPDKILRYVKPTYDGLIGDNDQEKIWAYLTSHGANKTGASGFMGVWEVESANNPSRLEGDYAMGGINSPAVLNAYKSQENMNSYVTDMVGKVYGGWGSLNRGTYEPDGNGNFYPGVGLAQWTGNRTKSVFEKGTKMGVPFNSLEAQLALWEDEVTNNKYYNSALTGANNAGTPAAAAEKVLNIYEGLSSTNQYAALSKRQTYANQFYERFKDWSPDVAAAKNTTPTGKGSASTGFGMVSSPGDAAIVENARQIKSLNGKNSGTVMTNTGVSLGLRSGTTDGSSVLVWIPDGTHLDELSVSGKQGWYKTTYGGQTGYVNAEWIVLDSDWRDGLYTADSIVSKPDELAKADEALKNLQNYANNSTGGNSGGTSTVEDYMLGKDAAEWGADWYTKVNNYDKFMYSDSKGNHYPLAGGTFSKLEKMGQLLFINKNKSEGQRNKYFQNVKADYGNSDDAMWAIDKLYDEAGSAQDWLNLRTQYIASGKKKNKNLFPDALDLLHVGMYGSGDTMSEMNFWDDYLGWNNKYANSNITTPVGEDQIDVTSDAYYDEATGTTVVNTYNVTRGEDKATEARLKAILANTYNVRSESMEALLEAILEELKRRKGGNGGPTNTSGSSKLFDERIPSQVTKLSVG